MAIRVDIYRKGVRELLRSQEIVDKVLLPKGRRIDAAAGPGHEVQVWIGRNRARVTVRTATTEARLAEAKNRNLTRAIEAARG